MHRAWLELVDADGPFLAIPPLKRVWPQGMPQLPSTARDTLDPARLEFERAWERLDRDPGSESTLAPFQQVRADWVRTVLTEVAGWQDLVVWGAGAAPEATVASPNRRVTVTPSAALGGPEGIGALVSVVPATQSLRDPGTDGWAASPIDRMEAMLRAAGVPIGIVTDGRWWALVCARPNVMVASGIVDALTWVEEPRTRDAFLTLIHRRHLIGGDQGERLPALFTESVAAAEEITEALGSQVRRAVELLVQAFSEAHGDATRNGRVSPLPTDGHTVYQACVTAMMQVVFLLFAEERGLLPQSHLFTLGYGISGQLDVLERRALDEGDESLDATFLTWHRLLATARALSTGAAFEDVRIPAYGGSLFDQSRFPFLTQTGENGTLALPIPDRVMLHVLRSVQVAQLAGGDARRICFRDIDVEQIGYIYEGLLGYTCTVVTDAAQLGLLGAAGNEPEIPLAVLEDLASRHTTPASLVSAILSWVKENQPAAKPASAAAYIKALTRPEGHDAAERHLRAVTDDEELRAQLLGWMPITRRDLRGRPTIVLAGGLLVTETPSRRNAGAHYTPRDLAEKVVHHALEPLCYFPGPYQTPDSSTWKLKSPDELLALKVADIAAGSGAFLVAAARYLAARLVEGWIEDDAANAHVSDLHRRALRQVVASCLYGADINEMAVEMCKLSLWLVSLDKALPFSFVDDKIFHGNSLLGLTDLRQLKALHIDPSRPQQIRFGDHDLDNVVRRAIDLRRGLASEVQENDPQRSANAKHRQLRRLNDLTANDVALADAVIAVGLAIGGKPGKQLDEAYENLRDALSKADPASGRVPNTTFLERIVRHGLTPTVPTDYDRWKPLHWLLEVPDVIVEHGGFDAVVGNPPFLGGKKFTGAMGANLRDWCVNVLANGIPGHADVVAYFLLRAASLLRAGGTLRLITTNTIAQGDTREVGLDQLTRRGMSIVRAIQSSPWPSASAHLEYAAIWGTFATLSGDALRLADGVPASRISTLLEPSGRIDASPVRLRSNEGGSYIGCYVLGLGFIVDRDTVDAWISANPRNQEVLFPYLSGEDLNSRPDCSPSRWVIDFGSRTETEAAEYVQPYQQLARLVRAERQKVNRKALRDRWWQHAERQPAMRKAIASLDEIIVVARVSKTVMPVRIPSGQVASEQVVIFATDSLENQGVLSSSLHQMWAVKYGSTLETRVRYTPSDVFDTFPRPAPTPELKSAAAALDTSRREMMQRRALGLTKLYNLVNDSDVTDDPDVQRLREMHVRLDQSVVAAYGWEDIRLGHGFHTYRQIVRWTVSPAARVELMDRLLEENLRRAKAERDLPPSAGRKDRGRPSMVALSDQEGLF